MVAMVILDSGGMGASCQYNLVCSPLYSLCLYSAFAKARLPPPERLASVAATWMETGHLIFALARGNRGAAVRSSSMTYCGIFFGHIFGQIFDV